MPYDEDLANRIRELLADEGAVTEKKMFGGLAFLVNGHMCVSASRTYGRAAPGRNSPTDSSGTGCASTGVGTGLRSPTASPAFGSRTSDATHA